MQFNLFARQEQLLAPLKLPDADVLYQSHWLTAAQAMALYEQLQQELSWRQDTIKLFSKAVKIPRLQAWYGAPHCHYAYSNLLLKPNVMTPSLLALQERLSNELKAPFNCVLANWYRDGNDGMGLHADDEPELGPEPVIASVSLGHARDFSFKHLPSGESTHMILEPGSLLVMRGHTQRYYHHGLSKTRKPIGGRINLTFRYIPDADRSALNEC